MFQLIFILNSFILNAATDECGKVLKTQGTVEILRLKPSSDVRNGIKASDQMKLECSDIILTGRASRAKLKIGTSLFTMSANSRFSIEEFDQKTSEPNMLGLLYGKVRALVKPRPAGSKELSITTPAAVMGVRGTDFFVGFDPNTLLTQQATIEGKVEVEQKTTNQKVMVESGRQVKVETPTPTEDQNEVKPLKVEPISEKVVEQIRVASYIAKDDQEFASKEAVTLLGEGKKWLPADEELPLDLRGIKNEF